MSYFHHFLYRNFLYTRELCIFFNLLGLFPCATFFPYPRILLFSQFARVTSSCHIFSLPEHFAIFLISSGYFLVPHFFLTRAFCYFPNFLGLHFQNSYLETNQAYIHITTSYSVHNTTSYSVLNTTNEITSVIQLEISNKKRMVTNLICNHSFIFPTKSKFSHI